MFALVILGMLTTPLLAFGTAVLRALVLFWPAMIALGALHSYVPGVPALGWQATLWLVAVLSLIIPTGASSAAE